MDKPLLYRKRIIPEEIILLDKDEILYSDDSHIITKWNTIKPKKILHHGSSCYFLKEGFKVSKFYREDGTLIYWYCDIISYSYDASDNSYVFTDLLADVLGIHHLFLGIFRRHRRLGYHEENHLSLVDGFDDDIHKLVATLYTLDVYP